MIKTFRIMPIKIARLFICIILASCCGFFTGCRDYRGLSQLTIVTGMAIDIDEENSDNFLLSFEVVDTSNYGNKDEVKTTLLVSKGGTIAEAVANASQKLHTDMYFGNTEMVIIGEPLLKQNTLDIVIDPLLRDNTIRDNLTVLISREKTAHELMSITEDNNMILAFQLNNAIGTVDRAGLNSSRALELDQIYSTLSRGADLTLPAIRLSGEEKKQLTIDGMGLFKDGTLMGYYDQEHVPYYIMASTVMRSGNIRVNCRNDKGEEAYITLKDRYSEAEKRVKYDGETFVLSIELKMSAGLMEMSPNLKLDVDDPLLEYISDIAKVSIEDKIEEVIRHSRDNFGVDAFDFGGALRNHNPKLWNEVKDNWDEIYKEADIQINCKVSIDDTGMMKNY